MPKLIDCVRGHLSEGDWYLWWDEDEKIWCTAQFFMDEDETPSLRGPSGGVMDVAWAAYKGYRIVHK
jgi:hypothetical protein